MLPNIFKAITGKREDAISYIKGDYDYREDMAALWDEVFGKPKKKRRI